MVIMSRGWKPGYAWESFASERYQVGSVKLHLSSPDLSLPAYLTLSFFTLTSRRLSELKLFPEELEASVDALFNFTKSLKGKPKREVSWFQSGISSRLSPSLYPTHRVNLACDTRQGYIFRIHTPPTLHPPPTTPIKSVLEQGDLSNTTSPQE